MGSEYLGTAEKITELLHNNEIEPAKQLAHKLRGIANNLGAIEVGRVSGEIESYLNEKPELPETILPELAASLTVLGESIDGMLANVSSSNTGASLGGATKAQQASLQNYARDMGLAFQIKDDILDVEGDAELVGKAVGKDENLGKATFVSILGLEAAREKAAQLGVRAKGHLEPFGKDAQTLRDTVDFVLHRSH